MLFKMSCPWYFLMSPKKTDIAQVWSARGFESESPEQ